MWYTMPPWRMNKQCAGGKETTGLFYVLFSAQSHTLLKKGAVQVIMGYVWSGMVLLSIFAALHTGQGGALTSAAMEGPGRRWRWPSPWVGAFASGPE